MLLGEGGGDITRRGRRRKCKEKLRYGKLRSAGYMENSRWWCQAGLVAIGRGPLPDTATAIRRCPHRTLYLPCILISNTYHFSSYSSSSYSSSTQSFIYLFIYYVILYYILFYFILTIRKVRIRYAINT